MLTLIIEAALLLAGAWLLARLIRPLAIPELLGMMAAGLLLRNLAPLVTGTDGLELAAISQEARLAVLAIILLRTGLSLSVTDFKRAGPLALRLGTIPMLGDAAAVTVAGILFLGLRPEAAIILGLVVAAISPAIVIPGLIDIRARFAGDRGAARVANALLAAAPLDNILAVIALGTALDLALAGNLSWHGTLFNFSWTIITGVTTGLTAGVVAGAILRRWPVLSLPPLGPPLFWAAGCFLVLVGIRASFSFVLALICFGAAVRALAPQGAREIETGLALHWRYTQYALFGLIGAAVSLEPLAAVGLGVLALIACGQLGRAACAWLVTRGLEPRQRLACVAAYVPKATIQAAFAGLALDRGLPEGQLVLSAGVLAIVVTAPLGVMLLHRVTPRLLASSPGLEEPTGAGPSPPG